MEELFNTMKPENFTTLRYENLIQWEVGKAIIKEALSHWEPLGFLDGIEDETKKEQISVAYDNMAHDLLFENERVVKIRNRYDFNCLKEDGEHAAEFDVIIFPMIRMVIHKTDNFKYDDLLDILEKLSFIAINYDDYNFDCDIEAEFCAMLSLLIAEHFKNQKNNK